MLIFGMLAISTAMRNSGLDQMLAAHYSFATPIDYQTNTLVHSAGNYRFADFARLGIPMNILTWLLCSALIPLFWPFQP